MKGICHEITPILGRSADYHHRSADIFATIFPKNVYPTCSGYETRCDLLNRSGSRRANS